ERSARGSGARPWNRSGSEAARPLRRERPEEALMERTDIDRREDRATGRTAIAVILLAVAVTSGVASASECGEDRAGGGTRKIVVRGDEGISPSAFTMNCGDVLAFENDSGEVVKLVCVEPRDQSEKIRCAPAD